MRYVVPEIRHNFAGYQTIARLASQTEDYVLERIEFDMSSTRWFDADMCAAFGAMLYRLSYHLNQFNLTNLPENVQLILSKNGFMSFYGGEAAADTWKTTIAYKQFDVDDDQLFAEYIDREFIQRSEIPSMTLALRKEFRKSIFEIFSNAVIHSQTKHGIFSCGQFYPKGQRLEFSVADLGVGIRQKVGDYLKTDLAPESAIDWATQGNNTTKQGSIPGGLGLKLLREFIDRNGGSIQIVSDAGYWCRRDGKTHKARISHPFPGTVVTLEINTADPKNYALATELKSADIF